MFPMKKINITIYLIFVPYVYGNINNNKIVKYFKVS